MVIFVAPINSYKSHDFASAGREQTEAFAASTTWWQALHLTHVLRFTCAWPYLWTSCVTFQSIWKKL